MKIPLLSLFLVSSCSISRKWTLEKRTRLIKRKHLLQIQSDRVIFVFLMEALPVKWKKLESFFKPRINRPVKKRKRGDGKEEMIKKESMQSYFLARFDCLRDFERLKMVACPLRRIYLLFWGDLRTRCPRQQAFDSILGRMKHSRSGTTCLMS